MLEALLEFIRALRARHVPVSLVETLDAMDALRRVDLLRRHEVYAALRATLVKRADHLDAFHTLFDVWFTAPAPDVEDVIAQLTAMVVGSTVQLAAGAPPSPAPPPPPGWGGRSRAP